MPEDKSVQDADISAPLREIHAALVWIIATMNEPGRDETLLAEAGVKLDRALFPLLVGVEHFGPIGVVDLAGRAGRDHTTVSRQLGRLERLGLIARESGPDRRVRAAVVTPRGREVTARIDAARAQLAGKVFAGWPEAEIETLSRLLRRLADRLRDPQ